MLKWLQEGLSWRWRRFTRHRYLRKTFRNGRALAQSYRDHTACDTAICHDGAVIRHPPSRTGLAGMILEIWYDEVYTGRFYTPAPGDVIIDAGANIGLFSLLVARRQPDCKVFAYEPFEQNFQLLSENLAVAGASAVRAFPFALAGESGASAMSDGGGRSQDHQLTVGPPADAGRPTVRTCSLAEVLEMTGAEAVQLFKCDIEGSERDLFAAATAETIRRVRRYAIEYHDNIRPGTLDLLIERLGPSHVIDLRPAGEGGYGMLYAIDKTAEPGAAADSGARVVSGSS